MNRNFFSSKNLGEDYVLFDEEVRRGTPTAAFGLSESHKYLLAAVNSSNILYITADPISSQKAAAALGVISGRKTTCLYAKDEVILYKEALSKDSLFRRICSIYDILNGAEIIVADIGSLMQLLPDEIDSITFNRGEEHDYTQIPKKLADMGYTREYAADTKGTFAIRGDILDIYPINSDNPMRVDFFGDQVERIRPYDSTSGERLEELKSFTVIAATDIKISSEEVESLKAKIKSESKKFDNSKAYERAKQIGDDLIDKLDQGLSFTSSSFIFPLLKSRRTIFDLIGRDTVIFFDECKMISDAMEGGYKEHIERFKDLKKGGEAFSFSEYQLLSTDYICGRFNDFRCVSVQTFITDTRFFRPLKTFNFHSTPAPSYLNSNQQLSVDVGNWLKNKYRVLIFTGSLSRQDKLSQSLTDDYFPVYPVPDRSEALHGVSVSSEEFEHGLIIHESKLVILGNYDLYTKAVTKRIKRRRGDMFVAPEVGDYCVHEKHGVGKIVGTRKIETTDGIKEYIAIEYKGGDNLYVPVEQMDVLSKYVGDTSPTLSKIGGVDFAKVKDRVIKSIKSLAFDLKALYAERNQKVGFNFPENRVMMEEFENSFDYEETADQLTSIEEIKADMCSDKVMDRLVCGDVGYGKTEVALRAGYLCVLGGKQAAIMCPSTVLSEQHYNTCVERFKEFGVRVEKLNRFRKPAEQARVLRELKEGKIDLIVGTHRLLSEDVKFHDLGLLVLDEEQRFGVEHKEKIKHVKKNIDCLTLTATPIPRTLHMSLAGIRDISTINTPPQKRLPVQTYVVEESETLIRDACVREISRGGQVFILYNRVETISSFAGRIAEIVPEARVCYAHGRMDRDTLENNVFSFYRGEKDILVTTTIIENGIDLPNANTIIIIDSDRLGISQLYQLRGRVGRGSRLAQAYFTFKPQKVLTSDAAERLKAIMRFTELGSGFKIAMRDLEIRGAGNVLGGEQHGHMDKVGYELYSKLLKEELTGQVQFSPELDIKAAAYIPEMYIESSSGRMDTYKQIAEIRTIEDYKRVCHSIEDNYGEMPREVLNLLIIAVLKSFASKFAVRKISVDSTEGSLELDSINALKDKRIIRAVSESCGLVKLSMAKAPLVIFEAGSNPSKTMREMTKFLKLAISFS